MSKKKSNPNRNESALIDADLIEKPIEKVAGPAANTVSLKDFMKTGPFAFNKENYKWLFIGLGINILGFILMIGGAAEDPNAFDADALFSHTRITLAPMLIAAGYVVMIFAIMKRPKEEADETK